MIRFVRSSCSVSEMSLLYDTLDSTFIAYSKTSKLAGLSFEVVSVKTIYEIEVNES